MLRNVVLACGVALGATAWAPGSPPEVFSELPYEEARGKAAEEDRLLVVDATAEWCAPCKRMDRTTWVDEDVVAWLGEHAVAVQVDVDERRPLAQSLGIRAMPTIIAFRGEKEVDRVVGYRGPEELLGWLADVRAGRSVLDGLRERVAAAEGGPELVDARYELAKQLATTGRYAEAAEEYAWLWRNMEGEAPAMTGVRVSFMASDMEDVANRNEDAKAVFVELRDATEARLKTDERDWDDLRDWLVLNGVVSDPRRTLGWIDRVKDTEQGLESMRRYSYLIEDLLLEHERWAEYGIIITAPAASVRREHAQIEQMVSMMADRFNEDTLKRMRAMQTAQFRETAAMIHAGLLAAGRDDEAWKALDVALELDSSVEMKRAVATGALRTDQVREKHLELVGEGDELRGRLRERLEESGG